MGWVIDCYTASPVVSGRKIERSKGVRIVSAHKRQHDQNMSLPERMACDTGPYNFATIVQALVSMSPAHNNAKSFSKELHASLISGLAIDVIETRFGYSSPYRRVMLLRRRNRERNP